MKITEEIRKAKERGLAITIYTVYAYPTHAIWSQAVELLKRHGITFFETSLSMAPASAGLSDQVGSGIDHLNRMNFSPACIARGYADLRPNLFIVHRASQLSAVNLESLFSELEGNVDALLLSEGSVEAWRKVRQVGLDLVVEVSPTMERVQMERTVSCASAFVYLQSAPATGGSLYPWEKIAEAITAVRSMTDLPICCGFGIRTPEEVQQFAKIPGCDGVIIGSEFLRHLRMCQVGDVEISKVEQYVGAVVAASRPLGHAQTGGSLA